jgi:membrane protein YqaA with SNARE-associated domain
MDGILESLASVVMAAGVGLASALIPLVNAETAAGAAGVKMSLWLAVAVSIALAVGQTVGKIFLFEAARKGAKVRARRRELEKEHAPKKPMPAWQQRLVKRLDGRWEANSVVLLSAGAGVPPLAVVSIAAGACQSRRLDFAVCCLLGRSVRFLAFTIPALVIFR